MNTQKKLSRVGTALILIALIGGSVIFLHGVSAQEIQQPKMSETALAQIEALTQEKESRTPEQEKIDSQLLYKLKQTRGEKIAPGLENLAVSVQPDKEGKVVVDIRANVTPDLLGSIKQYNGEIVYAYERLNAIRARLPLEVLEKIAASPDVKFIVAAEEPETNKRTEAGPVVPKSEFAARAAAVRARLAGELARRKKSTGGPIRPTTSPAEPVLSFLSFGRSNLFLAFTGAQNSEGDAAHRAGQVRALGINGNGVRIGVLSDSVRFLAASQATNDLPAVVTVVPGQSGIDTVNTPPTDTGEGTAMLEIIHDLAPQAQLFYATAFGGEANMANNITTLAGAPFNCDIIVDDVGYFNAGVFQDGTVAQAVNTVTAAGVLYFSSAGNAGNLNDGTSGVWEGDFIDGGTLALTPGGRVHDFGGGVTNNQILRTGRGTRPITLKWSDPLQGSNNDYDLFILNPTLTAVVASSTNIQNGSQAPVESIFNNTTTPVFNDNDRIVILRRTGAATRALHLNSNRGRLGINTSGQTFGHSAAANAFSVAAVDQITAGGGVFTGGAVNPVERFSSDGLRRIFFNPAGVAITPGNVLFGTNGGTVRQKPDIAAADGVTTTVPGFIPFFGTSAAAPHAAAIAALLLSFNNALTPAQIRTALTSSALDIEAGGVDRDSGAGIVMALQALSAVSSADLSITKTDSPDPVVAGTNLIYTINLVNNGTGPAVFAQISDNLPAGTTFRSLTQPAGWNCTNPGVGNSGTITCRKDTMAVSETAAFSLEVRVDAAVADGTTLSNTATISSTTADPNGGNNSATATTMVIAQADLEVVSLVGTPNPVVTNNPLTYTILIRNNGPSVATSVTLTDNLPIDALFNNCLSTGGGVCGGAGQNRTVTFASLTVGATATVTLETTANCALADGAIINNTAMVSAPATDPNPANNAASEATTAVNPPPVITCPEDLDVIALTPGSVSVLVNYPAPMVTDNCPGAVVVCIPASGSNFPLGVTTVNCTATDSGGATDTCSFNVTVWDACIQDDNSGDYLLFNTFTGDYKFVRCGIDGFTMIGRGYVHREGCITTLKDDTRISNASFDRCHIAPMNSGTATIKRQQPDTTFILKDRNILNNSPTCP